MNKSLLAIMIVSCITLASCGDKETSGNSSHDSVIDNSLKAETKIDFDLLSDTPVVITPSFIAMDSSDGTIDSEKTATDRNDQTDPVVAMGKSDGWSTTQPILIHFTGEPLDKEQDLSNVFKMMLTSDPTSKPENQDVHETMLIYNEDYTIAIDDFSLTIQLLKPLQSASNYMYTVTDRLKDVKGKPVGMTLSYAYLKSSSTPPSPELGSANTLTRIIESRFKANEIDPDTIIYSSWFKTESIGASLAATKAVIAKVLDPSENLTFADIWHGNANPNNVSVDDLYKITLVQAEDGNDDYPHDVINSAILREMITNLATANPSMCDILGGATIEECIDTLIGFMAVMSQGPEKIDVYHGTVTLPIFSTTEVEDDLWSTMPWQSATPSVAKIKNVLAPNSVFSEADQQAVREQLNKLNIDTLKLFNLDINELIKLTGQEIRLTNNNLLDEERLITKYSPIPQIKSVQEVPIIFFVPSDSFTPDTVSLSKITIFQHGITAQKELAYFFIPSMEQQLETKTGTRTAIVAIDTVLHGERGLEDPNGTGGNHDIVTNAATPEVFMNLEHLLVARDNLRQSIIDTIGLRVALSSEINQDALAGDILAKLDQNKISYYGHSMGAISGISSYAIANQELGDVSTNKGLNASAFQFTAGAFANPGGNISSVLLESATLSPVVKHGVLLASEGKYGGYDDYLAKCGDAIGFEAIKTCLNDYMGSLGEQQAAELATMFAKFSYAAQTVMDTIDPLALSAKVTGPVYLMEAAGDQVVPNQTYIYSDLGGTEPLAAAFHLDSLKNGILAGGKDLKLIARFNHESNSTHITAMLPIPGLLCFSSPEACATQELNLEIGTFLAQDGQGISVDKTEFLATDLSTYSPIEPDHVESLESQLNPLKLIDLTQLKESIK